MPGPSDKCMGSHEEEIRPKHLMEIFYTFGKSGDNCGDLMFSGHMSSILTLSCVFLQHGRRLLDPYTRLFHVVRITILALLACQATSIVVARNHYTVDVVGAVVMVLLFWRLYGHEIPELEPVHFLEEYREATKQPQSKEAKERAEELLKMSDEEFAEHLQYRGATQGGIAVCCVIVTFVLGMGSVFAAMLSGGH